nr:hypothetical protein [Sphingomonas sp. 66-10]
MRHRADRDRQLADLAATALPDLAPQLGHLVQERLGAACEEFAVRRRARPLGGTLEQLDAKLCLQPGNALAERWLRYAKRARRAVEPLRLDHGHNLFEVTQLHRASLYQFMPAS